jgi:hypothetical protein
VYKPGTLIRNLPDGCQVAALLSLAGTFAGWIAFAIPSLPCIPFAVPDWVSDSRPVLAWAGAGRARAEAQGLPAICGPDF